MNVRNLGIESLKSLLLRNNSKRDTMLFAKISTVGEVVMGFNMNMVIVLVSLAATSTAAHGSGNNIKTCIYLTILYLE